MLPRLEKAAETDAVARERSTTMVWLGHTGIEDSEECLQHFLVDFGCCLLFRLFGSVLPVCYFFVKALQGRIDFSQEPLMIVIKRAVRFVGSSPKHLAVPGLVPLCVATSSVDATRPSFGVSGLAGPPLVAKYVEDEFDLADVSREDIKRRP